MKILKVALENRRYDLAAHALVLSILKVSNNRKKPANAKKPKTQ